LEGWKAYQLMESFIGNIKLVFDIQDRVNVVLSSAVKIQSEPMPE